MGDTKKVSGFKGLNNVGDPVFLGLKWLTQADNVNLTEDGAVIRRDGYAKVFSGAMTGAFSTYDFKRMYIVDGGDLKRIHTDLSTAVLATGLTAAPMCWAEVNDYVYFSNGASKGVIAPDDAVMPWAWPQPATPDLNAVTGRLPAGTYQVCCTYLLPNGAETGAGDANQITVGEGASLQITNIPQVAGLQTQVYIAPADSAVFQLAFATTRTAESWNASPETLGVDLVNQFYDPAPEQAVIPAYWKGRMYLMQYLPAQDMTVIWYSLPLGFHLFNLNEDFMSIPGKGVLLAPTPDGLVIGTTTHIYSVDVDGKMTTHADYGCVPGHGWAVDVDDENNIVFWTQRGICTALPFENQTMRQISVAPGAFAAAAIVREDGRKRFVVALQHSGAAFNRRN
jgi:hypothetical protein